jgi:hypothetical protein
MEFKNNICQKFERQINNEIAFGQQHDYIQVKALKEQIITPGAKLLFGIPDHVPLTMYDLAKSSVDVLSKLRFIYLLSLLEAFGKEYIAQRESVALDELPTTLSSQKSKWMQQQGGVLSSTSFLNLAFLAFALRDRYGIDFDALKDECFWEAGVIRNCLMHHSGVIPNEAFRVGLQASVLKLGIENTVGSQLVISDKLVWVYIENSRAFIKACDY